MTQRTKRAGSDTLAKYPLPASLKKWSGHVVNLPEEVINHVILAGVSLEFTDDQIGQGIVEADKVYNAEHNRCVACLHWRDDFDMFCRAWEGEYQFWAICARCAKMISRGRATKQMAENVRSYVRGGVE